MRAIVVTGDRHATWKEWGYILAYTLGSLGPKDIMIHGNQGYVDVFGVTHGIDTLAWKAVGQQIGCGVEAFPADWKEYGKAAGPIRNQQMVDRLIDLGGRGYGTEVLAFHNNLLMSKGTADMVRRAGKAHVFCRVYQSDGSYS